MEESIGFNTIPRDRNPRDILPEIYEVKEITAVFEVAIPAKHIDTFQIIASKTLREKIVGTITVYGLILSIEEIIDKSKPIFQPTKCGDSNYRTNITVRAKVVNVFEGVLLTDCKNPTITDEQATYHYGENNSIVITVPFAETPDFKKLIKDSASINLLVQSVTANCGATKIFVVAQPFVFGEFPYGYRITNLSKCAMVRDDKEASTVDGKKISFRPERELKLLEESDAFSIIYEDEPRYTLGDVKKEIKKLFDIKTAFEIDYSVEEHKMFTPAFQALAENRDVFVFEARELDTVPMLHILYLLVLYYQQCFIYIPFCIDPLCGIRYVVCKGYRGRGDVPKQIYEAAVTMETNYPDFYLGSLFIEGIPENDTHVLVYHNKIFESIQKLEKLLPGAETPEYQLRIKHNTELWKKKHAS